MTDDYDLIGNVQYAEPGLGLQHPQSVFKVHPATQCAGEFCCIHNPSNHRLRDAPLNFRFDRGITERICEHGVGHPDPDSGDFLKRVDPERYKRIAWGIHGCDGCCGPSLPNQSTEENR